MQLRLDKPWLPLDDEHVRRVPGQLGVYQVAGPGGEVVCIGYAGAKELFGLRSALATQLAAHARGATFRYEVNVQYQSRWRELLMLHVADYGALPEGNRDDAPARLGRLR